MKSLKIVAYTGAVALIGLGVVMVTTNPSQDDYEKFAVQQLTKYLKKDVCQKVPKAFENFLQRNCSILVDSSRPQMQQIIAQTTRKQNFLFFSVYKTDLFINPLIPSYHFETVGLFENFYIYLAEKQ